MPAPPATVPPGLRLYAVGDIHGRADLLDQLLDQVAEDARSATDKVRMIFLGDYVDRGLYSKQVIERLIELRDRYPGHIVFLLGNHEQVMRELLQGRDGGLLQDWLRFGGRETLLSYGVGQATIAAGAHAVMTELREKMPPSHVDFIERLRPSAIVGDYFFCHAGIRPGVAFDKQTEQDLVWIRYDFLAHEAPHGKIVVHGHTIAQEAEVKSNRINIDTGAYATGCLTALALEGNELWFLQTK